MLQFFSKMGHFDPKLPKMIHKSSWFSIIWPQDSLASEWACIRPSFKFLILQFYGASSHPMEMKWFPFCYDNLLQSFSIKWDHMLMLKTFLKWDYFRIHLECLMSNCAQDWNCEWEVSSHPICDAMLRRIGP